MNVYIAICHFSFDFLLAYCSHWLDYNDNHFLTCGILRKRQRENVIGECDSLDVYLILNFIDIVWCLFRVYHTFRCVFDFISIHVTNASSSFERANQKKSLSIARRFLCPFQRRLLCPFDEILYLFFITNKKSTHKAIVYLHCYFCVLLRLLKNAPSS